MIGVDSCLFYVLFDVVFALFLFSVFREVSVCCFTRGFFVVCLWMLWITLPQARNKTRLSVCSFCNSN